MPNLTSQQANKLANNFLALAQSVGEYRYTHYSDLSPDENQQLKNYHWSILNCSDDLFTLSANIIIEDVETSLNSISEITNQIKGTYQDLQNVQKAINVATSVVTLGAAIVSKNPQAIADSISGLVESWNE